MLGFVGHDGQRQTGRREQKDRREQNVQKGVQRRGAEDSIKGCGSTIPTSNRKSGVSARGTTSLRELLIT